MPVLVCRQEAGAVWVENAQGDLVASCFFKTAEETEAELQAMGYPRLLTVYPVTQIVAGPGLDPPSWARSFWRGRWCRPGPTAAPPRDDPLGRGVLSQARGTASRPGRRRPGGTRRTDTTHALL